MKVRIIPFTLLLLLAPLACLGQQAAGHEHVPASSPMAAVDGGSLASAAKGARGWTSEPLILPAERLHTERSAVYLRTDNIAASALTVFAPAGPAARRRVDYPLDAGGARIEAAAPRMGNYHWVIAREETPEAVRVASTAWYFSNPGPSPRELLLEPKHELEIIPQPLPREHASYRESEKWRFLVRFKGAPLANQPLTLETAMGTRTRVYTDGRGLATVLLPRDLGAAHERGNAGHAQQGVPFVLATTWQSGGRRYETAFNHFYAPDPERNRSLGWGALFGLIGMLAAAALLVRRNARRAGDHDHA